MTSEDDHRPVSAHLCQNINDRALIVTAEKLCYALNKLSVQSE